MSEKSVETGFKVIQAIKFQNWTSKSVHLLGKLESACKASRRAACPETPDRNSTNRLNLKQQRHAIPHFYP